MCSDIYWNHCTFAEHLDIIRNLLMICACMCQQHFCISKESKSHLNSSICCFNFFFSYFEFYDFYLKTSRRSLNISVLLMNFPQKEKENSAEAGRWSCQSQTLVNNTVPHLSSQPISQCCWGWILAFLTAIRSNIEYICISTVKSPEDAAEAEAPDSLNTM